MYGAVEFDITNIPAGTNSFYIRCNYQFPPLYLSTDQDILAPFSSKSAQNGFFVNTPSSKTPPTTTGAITYPFPTVKASTTCQDNPSQCGYLTYSAGQGLAGTFTYSFYAPFMLGEFDIVSIDNLDNANTITGCTIGGATAQIRSKTATTLEFFTTARTGAGEMGTVSIVCSLIIGTKTTVQNSTVKVQRAYFPDPEARPTPFERFTAQVKMTAPTAAVIGRTPSGNDASIQVYAEGTPTKGTKCSVQIETRHFNTALTTEDLPGTGDAPIPTTLHGSITLSINTEADFLEIDPDTTPACTWTLNTRAPNYAANRLSGTTLSINNDKTIIKFTTKVDRDLTLADATNSAVRIFCSGLKLSNNFNKPLPYTPALTASMEVKSPYGTTVGTNSAIPFGPLVQDIGGKSVVFAHHTLLLKAKSHLTQKYADELISLYKSTLKLQSNVYVFISTQSYDPNANILRVNVAIRGVPSQPSEEIKTLLSASAATTIANALTNSLDLKERAAQTPASLRTVPGHCNNQLKDQDETGTDCGGAQCLGCVAANASCLANSDCSSGICGGDGTCISLNGNGAPVATAIIAVVISIAIIAVQLF